MPAVKFQHAGQMDGAEEPAADVAHQEEVHAKAEQIENNDEHHEDVIDQIQLEWPAVRV